MKFTQLILILGLLGSCTKPEKSAQEIVDSAIGAAGGAQYESMDLSFDFREYSYAIQRKDGMFKMRRIRKYSNDSIIEDVLTNDGYYRMQNDSIIEVPDSMATKYQSSVNSVFYFFSLPYGLNDAAVNKARLDDATIKSKVYYKIKVWFDEEGGGEDHEDTFIFWFDQEDYSMDYFAYEYQTNGGGMRFREAMNERRIGGIKVVDYINYKPTTDSKVEDLDQAFESGSLSELSRIENQNVMSHRSQ